jgi:hypothetical protein
VPERNRQENRNEPGSDRSLKPLIDEYLASTREPVGSRNLFRETPDQSEQVEEPRAGAGGRDEAAPAEPAAIILYLVCLAVLLIAALAVGFL